jgi:hypothetical protein
MSIDIRDIPLVDQVRIVSRRTRHTLTALVDVDGILCDTPDGFHR